MKYSNIQAPQPIPYPDHPILKGLYRLPILAYRMGLGRLIGKYILILSTTGRKSGKTHRTPVEYFRDRDRIFVMSGFGSQPDWYKNLQANPQATLTVKESNICVQARNPETEAEWDGVISFLKNSPVSQLSEPWLVDHLEDFEIREAIKRWPILTFDPTANPCPSPLDADLVWAWPPLLLSTALLILAAWLIHRKN